MATNRRDREAKRLKYTSAKSWADNQKAGDRTAIALPDDIPSFKISEKGVFQIDLLPYIVGQGNPNAPEGRVHFERTYFIHGQVGPDKGIYICPQKTWNKPCPICQFRAKLEQKPDADEKLIQGLYWKKRQLFLVIDHNDREAGPKVWDMAYGNFGKTLRNAIDLCDSGDEEFFRLDSKGRSLRCGVTEESFGGKKYFKVSTVEFRPRKTQLDEDLIDSVPCLDDLPIAKKYEELKKIFMQTADGEDDDGEDDHAGSNYEQAERQERRRHSRDDDDDEPDDEPDDSDEDEPAEVHKSGRRKPVVDDDDDDDLPPDDDDSDEDEDDD